MSMKFLGKNSKEKDGSDKTEKKTGRDSLLDPKSKKEEKGHFHQHLRVAVIGETGVGATSLIDRIVNNRFPSQTKTFKKHKSEARKDLSTTNALRDNDGSILDTTFKFYEITHAPGEKEDYFESIDMQNSTRDHLQKIKEIKKPSFHQPANDDLKDSSKEEKIELTDIVFLLVDLRKPLSAEELKARKQHMENQCGGATTVHLVGVRLDEVGPNKAAKAEDKAPQPSKDKSEKKLEKTATKNRKKALELIDYQVSAKTGEGIEDMLEALSKYILKNDGFNLSFNNQGF